MKTLPIPPYLKDYAHDLTLLRIQENKDRIVTGKQIIMLLAILV